MADEKYIPLVVKIKDDGQNKSEIDKIKRQIQKQLGSVLKVPVKVDLDNSSIQAAKKLSKEQKQLIEKDIKEIGQIEKNQAKEKRKLIENDIKEIDNLRKKQKADNIRDLQEIARIERQQKAESLRLEKQAAAEKAKLLKSVPSIDSIKKAQDTGEANRLKSLKEAVKFEKQIADEKISSMKKLEEAVRQQLSSEKKLEADRTKFAQKSAEEISQSLNKELKAYSDYYKQKAALSRENYQAEVTAARQRLNGAKGIARVFQELGTSLTIAVTAPIVGIGKFASESSRAYESGLLKLQSITGSAAVAKRQFKELYDLAKLPAVDLKSAISDSAKLQASGFTFGSSTKLIRNVSNIVARSGGGDEDTSEILRQLSQTRGKNKFSAQDFNIILDRAPELAKLVREKFGAATAEGLRDVFKITKKSTEADRKAAVDTFFKALEEDFTPEKVGKALLSFNERFANLRQDVERAFVPIGNVINEELLKILEKLVPIIQKASEAFESLPKGVQQAIVYSLAFAAALGPVLYIVGTLSGAILHIYEALVLFVEGFSFVTGAAVTTGSFLTGIGEILLVVAGAVALFYAAWETNFGGIRDIVQQVVDYIKLKFDDFRQFWNEIWPELQQTLSTVWTGIVATFNFASNVIKSLWNALWPYLSQIVSDWFSVIGDLIKGTLQFLTGNFSGARKTVSKLWSDMWTLMKDMVALSMRAILSLVKDTLSGLSKFLGLADKQGSSLGHQLGSAIIIALEAAAPGVYRIIEKILSYADKRIAQTKAAAESAAATAAANAAAAAKSQEINDKGLGIDQASIDRLSQAGADLTRSRNASKFSGGGGAGKSGRSKGSGSKVKSEYETLTDEFNKLNKEISAFRDLTSKEFDLKFKISELQQVKENLNATLKAYQNINKLENVPHLPVPKSLRTDLPGSKDDREFVERLEKLNEAVSKKVSLDLVGPIQQLQQESEEVQKLNKLLEKQEEEPKTAVEKLEKALGKLGDQFPGLIISQEKINDLREKAAEIDEAERIDKANKAYEKLKEHLLDITEKAEGLTQAQRALRDIDKITDLDPAKRRELEDLQSQARNQEIYKQKVDAAKQVASKISGFFNDAFRDSLEGKPLDLLGRLEKAFKETFARILANLVGNFFSKLIAGFSGINLPGSQVGQGNQGGGFNILNLLGLGPGGTSGFSGPIGSASGGAQSAQAGGLIGLLANKFPSIGKFFGFGGTATRPRIVGTATRPRVVGSGGTAAASNAGFFSSLGASGLLAGGGILGQFAGGDSQIGRLLGGVGGTVLAGVAGASGIFGSGVAAALPALFSNPITAIVGAGLIGGALLFNFLGNKDLKKLRKAIKSRYGVDIKDNNVLKQIKQIGQKYYGKAWQSNISQLIETDEVRSIVENYAESTGQGNSEIAREKKLLNPNNPINKIDVGVSGSSSSSSSSGSSSSGNTSIGSGGGQIGQLTTAINTLSAKITGMSPGDIITANPEAVAKSAAEGVSINQQHGVTFLRNTGVNQ